MTRSRRKTPIFGHTGARTEKQDKRLANRKLRRKVKSQDLTDESKVIPRIMDVSDTWSFDKDGKSYWSGATSRNMRK